MNFIWLIILSLGLCFDTFAISVSIGMAERRTKFLQALKIAVIFSFFQGVMPWLGWMLGRPFEKYIAPIDHWIALILLSIVGVKMILEAFGKHKSIVDINNIKMILTLALATSIDAFAVGITLSFTNTNIWLAAPVIGFFTGVTAMLGMLIGKSASAFLGSKVQIVGGIIIIGIGLKICLEHLEVFN